MKLAEDYLRLRSVYSGEKEGEPFRVTIDGLAEALYCTPRNARLILRKMADAGLIRYAAGQGRGHRSELTFLADKRELVIREAQQYVKQGDVQGAMLWVKEQAGEPGLTQQFMDWLTGYFGYRTETTGEGRMVETLRLPIYRPIVTLDPADAMYAFDTHLIRQIHATLVELEMETGKVIPGVAHHWESSSDACCWTFFLRKGVTFHDGTELTADDVKYSLLRVQQESKNHSWLCRDIVEIYAESRYIVRMELRQPNVLFAVFMSHTGAAVLSRASGESGAGSVPGMLPIGSGPYRIAKLTPGMCMLEVFPDYYAARGLIDRIEVMIMPDTGEEWTVETNPGVLVVETGEARRQELKTWRRSRLVTGCSMLTMNLAKPGILQTGSFRRALALAVDRGCMVRDLGYPHAFPCLGFHLEPQPDNADPLYDPEEASRELKRSGYRGEGLKLYAYRRHEQTARWLQQQYGLAGIRLDVHILPWEELMKEERTREADLILFEALLSEGLLRQIEYLLSRYSFIRSMLDPGTQAEVDRLVGQLLQEADPGARGESFQRLESWLMERGTAIYLTYNEARVLSHPAQQGVRLNAAGWVDFKDIWFKGEG
ncbi:MarR-like DNA-binding transcriptional regulator SgrR of sgrS sRNA [Paenibacillus rhizosphaerae]|uniref:MarR-like DNA-binding transcriptional regulator SgrR of sgrS sRNA n=1 Tax=Paenibacillus rhizosphaerae TaxID=297318 RepID=A0A839TLH7_9BACL|nr:ABC transporter substrate-binding protein [Paenibacillus rhizosphaerae]MBB3125677.1 MarR-like DNA-binding transcriptional regulator SgrR of sgrS sRNA [Paenibacillus rhizosphaerae]